jgi:hypothetical protein
MTAQKVDEFYAVTDRGRTSPVERGAVLDRAADCSRTLVPAPGRACAPSRSAWSR